MKTSNIFKLAKNIKTSEVVQVEIIGIYEHDFSLIEVKYKGKNYLVKRSDLF